MKNFVPVRSPLPRLRQFLRDTRAGATAIAAASVTIMTIGGAALIIDHVWIVDQRDVLKSAVAAAGIGATQHMVRLAGETHTDDELKAKLKSVARRYVLLNLAHLRAERYKRADDTLTVEINIDRDQNTVSVTATTDLGGTFVSRHLPMLGSYAGPERVLAKSETECSGGTIELVLALDVTASMNAAIHEGVSNSGANKRMLVAIEAAKTLVDELHSGCDDTDVAIGVVPWDKTVRVPSPKRWQDRGWVDTGAFHAAAAIPGYEPWRGCVADRHHAAHAPRSSDGLSLKLPSDTSFPAFMYPDTSRLDPAIIEQTREKIFRLFQRHGVERDPGADAMERLLRERSENPWDRDGAGPNFHCTWTPMLSLTSARDEARRALDSLYDPSREPVLLGGVTMSHIGVTWGRRMLAPTWRTVWGDDVHPVDPAETVTKVLVLLTDGQNGAFSDQWEQLPGRLGARYDSSEHEIRFDCEPRKVSGCREVRGDTVFARQYASRYTAVGRFGEGRPEDGFPVQRRDFSWARTAVDARMRLKDLMLHSCALAHEEGLTIYTVSLLSPGQSLSDGWKDQLVTCSGTAGTASNAERENYHLQGTDRDSLVSAFRTIGKRLVTVRRTS